MTCPRWLPAAPILLALWAALAPACGGRGGTEDGPRPDGGSDAGTHDSGADAAIARDATVEPGRDAAVDGDAAVSPGKDASMADAGADASIPGSTLDDCFAGLPAPVGPQMLATKSSADGRLRIRIALDTMNMPGTPGTAPWKLIRLGVEMDGSVTCIADAADLAYTASHHNCADKASASAGTMAFNLTTPDRPNATLTARDGGNVVVDSVVLTDVTCTMRTSYGPEQCRSGGPCF